MHERRCPHAKVHVGKNCVEKNFTSAKLKPNDL